MAFLPALLIVTVRFSERLRPVLQDVQQKIADVTETAEENVMGSRIVRIFAREDDELEKFSERSYRVFEASVAAARVRAVYIPLIAFLPNLAVAFLLWYGGRQVIEGQMTLGALVAFYSYLMMFVYPAQVIGWLTGLMQRAIASGNRVYEVLDAPLEMTERADARPLRGPAGGPPAGAVTFDDVYFSYVDRPVLEAVEPRGAGRSHRRPRRPHRLRQDDAHQPDPALLRRQRGPRAGRRRGRARPAPRRPAPPHRHRQSGPLPVQRVDRRQHPVRPPGGHRRARCATAAKAAQADEFIAALPEGYDTVIGERGFTLSGGQRQRIAIARALVMDPRILILDDATSSVDVETEFKIRRALQEVTHGRTTFIIAHRPSTISLADEIVVLDKGASWSAARTAS